MTNKHECEVITYSTDYYNRRSWKEAWDMPLHIHDAHELYYLYEGNVQYSLGTADCSKLFINIYAGKFVRKVLESTLF